MTKTALIEWNEYNLTTRTMQKKSRTVTIGDWVGFKSDIEQSGKIIDIEHAREFPRRFILTLRNEDGFSGEYLRHAKQTQVDASDCWVEDDIPEAKLDVRTDPRKLARMLRR